MMQAMSQLSTAIRIACVLVAVAAMAASQQFDLGGPCVQANSPAIYGQIQQARKNGNWYRAVELQKESVRGGCQIEYRWAQLADVLVAAGRGSDAVQVVTEMDSRGFDLSPSGFSPDVLHFMETPLFKAAAVGRKIDAMRKASDGRRAVYQEVLAGIPASQRPPDHYVAHNACPFECCHFGAWEVTKDTPLVASPGSRRVTGHAQAGTRVIAKTGEVHLTPEPVVVVGDGPLPKNSIAFILDYLGEGYAHVYFEGNVAELFQGVAAYCFRPSESCWGETLLPARQVPKPVWWIRIQLPNGVTGWTDKAQNFSGMDGCG